MSLKQRKQIFLNEHNKVKNPNWQEADQLAIYKAWSRLWTRDNRETNPASGRASLEPRTSGLQHKHSKPLGHAYLPKSLTFLNALSN